MTDADLLNTKERFCKVCNKKFIKKDKGREPFFCSKKCEYQFRKERILKNARLRGLRSEDYYKEKSLKYASKYPEKESAQRYTQRNLLRDTECLFCGKKDKLQFHHLRYRTPTLPEDVITICNHCHSKLHLVTKEMIKSESDLKAKEGYEKGKKDGASGLYTDNQCISCMKAGIMQGAKEERAKTEQVLKEELARHRKAMLSSVLDKLKESILEDEFSRSVCAQTGECLEHKKCIEIKIDKIFKELGAEK